MNSESENSGPFNVAEAFKETTRSDESPMISAFHNDISFQNRGNNFDTNDTSDQEMALDPGQERLEQK